jgi:hypothetical protein
MSQNAYDETVYDETVYDETVYKGQPTVGFRSKWLIIFHF